ncbi:hypothetical protein [Phytomonospora endophytica]|uniref:Uncharacterized protein n=1 Tax=Phytomonospora endophytica TaxID=714109 RepID=A0A841FRW0_9ACTN|nr:hypothetical protein [Phytomonospora endophytica]MBB6038534.1 hypothetical protein [Phytomonospora endophytica]GIG69326.1 hypothetical protein Pen01_56210 [Phytomonospora endophytica]
MPAHDLRRVHLTRSPHPTGAPPALQGTACTSRQPALAPDTDDTDGDVYSLLDEYAVAFRSETDALDLLLHSVAGLIDITTRPDRDIPIARLLTELAPGAWRRHDNDRLLIEAATAFLVSEATWLIAFASGVPGSDRHSTAAQASLGWLDAAPRPLRAQLIRATAARYVG